MIVPVASAAQPVTVPPSTQGLAVWSRTSMRRMYGEPKGNVVAFVLVTLPVMGSKVTISICSRLFSGVTVIGTLAESLGANVPSPA